MVGLSISSISTCEEVVVPPSIQHQLDSRGPYSNLRSRMSGLGREFAHGLARRELSSGECHTQTHQQRHEAWESVTPVTSATSVTRDQHHPIGRDSQIACRFFQAFERYVHNPTNRMAAQPLLYYPPLDISSAHPFASPLRLSHLTMPRLQRKPKGPAVCLMVLIIAHS
jgi:hypothetical protein